MYHAGRPELTPPAHCASCTIIDDALVNLVGHADRSQVEALVVGNICGNCFKHEEAMHLVEPFMQYPASVFTNRSIGALDIYEVIRYELMHRGVQEKNIKHEGSCTFESSHLSSYRRDRSADRNTIILVRDK